MIEMESIYYQRSLPLGTVLDERYIIEELFSANDFCICYIGTNLNSNSRVFIYEYFRSDYMSRNPGSSEKTFLFDENDDEKINIEKENLLKEARIIRDYAGKDAVLNITDYFSSNNTVYVISKYTPGMTLADYVSKKGVYNAETSFRQMIPIISFLGKLHQSGLIHRNINPNNIWITKTGEFKIVDLGIPQDYSSKDQTYTAMMQNEFVPSEYYDHDMRQGPWTDIYSLCAVLYYSITGSHPTDALERIFNDDLLPPSELDIPINPNAERIIMKGLSLDTDNRYSNTDLFITDINKVFPESEKKNTPNKALYILIPITIIIISLILIWANYNEEKILFPGQQTISFYLLPSQGMTEEKFLESAEIVKDRFRAFAGKDKFLWKRNNKYIKVTSSLDIYNNQDVEYIIKNYFLSPWELYTWVQGKDFPDQFENPDSYYPIKLPANSFDDIEICYGRISEYDTLSVEHRERAHIPEKGDYYYIKTIINTENKKVFPKRIQNNIKSFSTQPLTKDIYYSSNLGWSYVSYGISGIFGIQPSTYYMTLDDSDKRLYEVAKHALASSPLSANQILDTIIEYPIIWEKSEKNNLFYGLNQVNAENLNEDTTILLYQINPLYYQMTYDKYIDNDSNTLSPPKSDMIKFSMSFKSYFDVLEYPYAFGTLFNGKYIAIKMNSSDFSNFIIDLSRINIIHFGNPNGKNLNCQKTIIKPVFSEKNYYVKFNECDRERIKEYLKQNYDSCYLYYEDHNKTKLIAKCSSELSNDGYLEIQNITFANKATNNIDILLNLVSFINNNNDPGREEYILTTQYYQHNNITIPVLNQEMPYPLITIDNETEATNATSK